jgi:hypothetical protein
MSSGLGPPPELLDVGEPLEDREPDRLLVPPRIEFRVFCTSSGSDTLIGTTLTTSVSVLPGRSIC